MHARPTVLIAFFIFFSLAVACGDSDSGTSTDPHDAGVTADLGTDAVDGGTDASCVPDCDGRRCGIDPVCGESCGSCPDGESCDDGMCVCVPACDGRTCGTDGCGGTCGTCATDEMCNDMTGVCAATCEPATCEAIGLECGTHPDGCGETIECGTCATGSCDSAGVCVNTTPTFAFTSPGGERAYALSEFELTWTDDDPDEDAAIELFWDDDNQGADGTLIIGGLSEDDPSDAYTWDLSALPVGIHWPYAVIDDGSGPVTVYAAHPVIKQADCQPLTGVALDVDIQTIDVAIDLAFKGAPVSSMNTGAGEGDGLIRLRRVVDGAIAAEIRATDSLPRTVRLVPGAYDVLYSQVQGPNWPAGEDILLQQAVELVNSTSLTVDVPAETLTFEITIDGQNPVLRDPNFSWPRFTLERSDGEGTLQTTPAGAFPVSLQVVPGTYTVSGVGVRGSLSTIETLPGEIGDVTSGQVNALDIQTALHEVVVTFEGSPLDTTNTEQATFDLLSESTDARVGKPILDPRTGTPNSPLQFRVPVGDYRLVYRGSTGGNWPQNRGYVLETGITAGTTTTTVDIQSVAYTIDLTLNGTAPTAGLAGSQLFVRHEDNAASNNVGVNLLPITGSTFSLNLLPGRYDVRYVNQLAFGTTASGVPLGYKSLGVFDTATGSQTFDFESYALTLQPNFIGSSRNANLFLSPSDARGSFIFAGEVNSGVSSVTVEAVADTYEIRLLSPRDRFLSDGRVAVGQVTLTSDQTESFDIEATSFFLDVLLNGQPLTSSDLNGRIFWLRGVYAPDQLVRNPPTAFEFFVRDTAGSIPLPEVIVALADRPLLISFFNEDPDALTNLPYSNIGSGPLGTLVGCLEASAP